MNIQEAAYVSRVLYLFDEQRGNAPNIPRETLAYLDRTTADGTQLLVPKNAGPVPFGQARVIRQMDLQMQIACYDAAPTTFEWFALTKTLLPGGKDATTIQAIRTSAAHRLAQLGAAPGPSPYRQLIEHVGREVLAHASLGQLRELETLRPVNGPIERLSGYRLKLLQASLWIQAIGTALSQYLVVKVAVGISLYVLSWKVFRFATQALPHFIRESILPACSHFLMQHAPLFAVKALNVAWAVVAWTVSHWFLSFAIALAGVSVYSMAKFYITGEWLNYRAPRTPLDKAVVYLTRLATLPSEYVHFSFFFPFYASQFSLATASRLPAHMGVAERVTAQVHLYHLRRDLAPRFFQILTTPP